MVRRMKEEKFFVLLRCRKEEGDLPDPFFVIMEVEDHQVLPPEGEIIIRGCKFIPVRFYGSEEKIRIHTFKLSGIGDLRAVLIAVDDPSSSGLCFPDCEEGNRHNFIVLEGLEGKIKGVATATHIDSCTGFEEEGCFKIVYSGPHRIHRSLFPGSLLYPEMGNLPLLPEELEEGLLYIFMRLLHSTARFGMREVVENYKLFKNK